MKSASPLSSSSCCSGVALIISRSMAMAICRQSATLVLALRGRRVLSVNNLVRCDVLCGIWAAITCLSSEDTIAQSLPKVVGVASCASSQRAKKYQSDTSRIEQRFYGGKTFGYPYLVRLLSCCCKSSTFWIFWYYHLYTSILLTTSISQKDEP